MVWKQAWDKPTEKTWVHDDLLPRWPVFLLLSFSSFTPLRQTIWLGFCSLRLYPWAPPLCLDFHNQMSDCVWASPRLFSWGLIQGRRDAVILHPPEKMHYSCFLGFQTFSPHTEVEADPIMVYWIHEGWGGIIHFRPFHATKMSQEVVLGHHISRMCFGLNGMRSIMVLSGFVPSTRIFILPFSSPFHAITRKP